MCAIESSDPADEGALLPELILILEVELFHFRPVGNAPTVRSSELKKGHHKARGDGHGKRMPKNRHHAWGTQISWVAHRFLDVEV